LFVLAPDDVSSDGVLHVGLSEMFASLSPQQLIEITGKYLCQFDRNGIAYLS